MTIRYIGLPGVTTVREHVRRLKAQGTRSIRN